MFYFEVVGQSATSRLWKWTKNKQRTVVLFKHLQMFHTPLSASYIHLLGIAFL